MMHVVALVLFLTDAGPIGAASVTQVYGSVAACEAGLAALAQVFEHDRLVLERQRKVPVRHVVLCHVLGVPA